jgi:hypothetical protein
LVDYLRFVGDMHAAEQALHDVKSFDEDIPSNCLPVLPGYTFRPVF